MKRYYTFNTRCPRCGSRSQINHVEPTPPIAHCGGCLMDEVEIVALICTPVEEARS